MPTVNPEIPGINHMCLCVKDLEKSLAFYDAIMPLMGWKPRKQGSVAYITGNYEIYLQESKLPEREFERYGVGLQHLAFNANSEQSVLDLTEKLRELGAEITDEPQKYPNYTEKFYAVFFKDPNGIQLEYCYCPDLEL